MDVGWIVVTAIVGGIAVGAAPYFKSLRRWRQSEPSSDEAKQAEARLWSTRSMDQR